jgi:hypothetical protein
VRPRYRVTRKDADSQLSCAVKPVGAARAAASPAVEVTSVPTNAALPVVTAAGGVLSCAPGSWSADVDDLVYGWTRNGSPVNGAETSTLTTSAADVGAGYACLVAGHNAAGTSGRFSSAVFTVGGGGPGPSAPSLTPVVVTAPSLAAGPGGFACSPGAWANDPTTFLYSWTRNGSPVPGATSSSLATTASDAGASYACLVAGSNAGGTSGYVSSPLVLAPGGTTPPGPPVTSVPTSSSAPSLGQLHTTLTCAPGTWAGVDSLGYAWTRNGSPHGATGATLEVGGDIGASYACLVRGTNAAGTSGYVSSNLVTVVADLSPPAEVTVAPVTTGDFGAYAIGDSTTLGFTVTNPATNGGPVTPSLGGASAAEFAISSSTCPATLPGGATCTVTVSFAPTVNGDKTATLTVSGAPGGSTALTALAAPPGITLLPVSYDFGAKAVGSSTTVAFRAVNTTGTAENIRGASQHGAGFGFNFGPDFTCVFTVTVLRPHRTCTVSFVFRPQSAGSFSAVVGVIGDSGTPTATVTGTGVPARGASRFLSLRH